MLKLTVQLFLFLSTLFCAQAQATVLLQLDPVGGAISGQPGETIGWGFTLSNDTDYLVVTSASFNAPSSMGSFTDYISQPSNFFVVGPPPESSTVSQVFDQTLMTGIGSFTIDPTAMIGSVVNSSIVLTYDLFSVSPNDPSFDPDVDTLSNGNLVTATASVSVVPGVAVPEPSTIFLIVLGFLGMIVGKRYKQA